MMFSTHLSTGINLLLSHQELSWVLCLVFLVPLFSLWWLSLLSRGMSLQYICVCVNPYYLFLHFFYLCWNFYNSIFHFLGLARRNVRRKMGSQQSSHWKFRTLRCQEGKNSQPPLKSLQSNLEISLHYILNHKCTLKHLAILFFLVFFFFKEAKVWLKKKGQITCCLFTCTLYLCLLCLEVSNLHCFICPSNWSYHNKDFK